MLCAILRNTWAKSSVLVTPTRKSIRFYRGKHVLHCMRSNLNMSSFNEAILFSGDSILIKEGCEIKKYKERDFSQKSSLLTPTIIR